MRGDRGRGGKGEREGERGGEGDRMREMTNNVEQFLKRGRERERKESESLCPVLVHLRVFFVCSSSVSKGKYFALKVISQCGLPPIDAMNYVTDNRVVTSCRKAPLEV